MTYSNPTINSTSARLLAVLALLFLLGAQVLESAHNHQANDSVSTCVLCSSGVGAALPTSIPSTAVIAATGVLLVSPRNQEKDDVVFTAYLPRGPPSNT
jgi:hypothetical protein